MAYAVWSSELMGTRGINMYVELRTQTSEVGMGENGKWIYKEIDIFLLFIHCVISCVLVNIFFLICSSHLLIKLF